jgi:hypothetical protein
MKKFKIKYIGLFLLCSFLVSCGGSSASKIIQVDDEDDKPLEDLSDKYASSGVISDPYIVGAVMCEDKNSNNSCDSDEQLSTISRSDGSFYFDKKLTTGSNILIKTQGKHNSKFYTINLKSKVTSDDKVVISPFTTLQAKSLSDEEIINILKAIGFDSITQSDIISDPMNGLRTKTELANDDILQPLQASLTIYGMLRIMEASPEFKNMTKEEFYNSAITTDKPINKILNLMANSVKSALNKSNFDSYKSTIDGLRSSISSIPKAKFNQIIKTSVTIMDRLIDVGFKSASKYDGNMELKTTKAIESINQSKDEILDFGSALSLKFFGLDFSSSLDKDSITDSDILSGINLDNASFVLDKNGIDTLTNSSSQVRVFVEADLNTKPYDVLNSLTCAQADVFGQGDRDTPMISDGIDCNNNHGVSAHTTPSKLKFAIKSVSIIDTNNNEFFIIDNTKLKDSAVFDATQRVEIGTLDIPNAHYTSVKVEYYYYWY